MLALLLCWPLYGLPLLVPLPLPLPCLPCLLPLLVPLPLPLPCLPSLLPLHVPSLKPLGPLPVPHQRQTSSSQLSPYHTA